MDEYLYGWLLSSHLIRWGYIFSAPKSMPNFREDNSNMHDMTTVVPSLQRHSHVRKRVFGMCIIGSFAHTLYYFRRH